MSFGSFSLRELTCMHCVYLALWTRKVLCGSFLCAIYKFSFIHSYSSRIWNFVSYFIHDTLWAYPSVTQLQKNACCWLFHFIPHLAVDWLARWSDANTGNILVTIIIIMKRKEKPTGRWHARKTHLRKKVVLSRIFKRMVPVDYSYQSKTKYQEPFLLRVL